VSYHDGYVDPRTAGAAVINPIAEQQKRLSTLEKLLKEIAEETDSDDLKMRINEVLSER
jgi:hypothetical protein